ncbi:MAG TPA: hypothetical protein VJS44_09520 [Pyrinomonadaceae bacterium]|nr:hypothetical protein [Pyrinomonadaceae bacterium]
MRVKAFASLLALLLLAIAAPDNARAESAAGSYRFSFEDGATKTLDFDAVKRADGSTVGQMYLTDEATLVLRDVDGAGDTSAKYAGYNIKATFDNMVVNKNQAVMSGVITDSSVRELIGKRVLLTVEDNGDNTRVPDKVTWGIYNPVTRDWVATDAERKDDDGASLKWRATDAERKDDEGIEMPRDESTTTASFPLDSYDFVQPETESGDIRVAP